MHHPAAHVLAFLPPQSPRLTRLRCPQVLISQKVVRGVYPGVTTSELDELAAETGTQAAAV